MLDDALRLTVDVVFPKGKATTQPYKVLSYTDEENIWEPICQIGYSKYRYDA